MALLDPFLCPIVEPEPPYAPAADVLLYAQVEGGCIRGQVSGGCD